MKTGSPRPASRREFLAIGFGWLPFWRPKHVELAGARFRIVRYGAPKRRYVAIHGNEETARQVLLRHIESHQGIAYLIEGTTRNVEIGGGQLDPNRMFSRVGAEANLKRLNPDWTAEQREAALKTLDRGRDRITREFLPPRGGLTVALHNNSEGYSVRDEEPISDAGSIREPDNPHAFFLCTDEGDFRKLATSSYNVVLQKKAPPQDDGSLSRLAAARGARYINIEVAHGQSSRQKEMLDWLEWTLREGHRRSREGAPRRFEKTPLSRDSHIAHVFPLGKPANSTELPIAFHDVKNRSCVGEGYTRLMDTWRR